MSIPRRAPMMAAALALLGATAALAWTPPSWDEWTTSSGTLNGVAIGTIPDGGETPPVGLSMADVVSWRVSACAELDAGSNAVGLVAGAGTIDIYLVDPVTNLPMVNDSLKLSVTRTQRCQVWPDFVVGTNNNTGNSIAPYRVLARPNGVSVDGGDSLHVHIATCLGVQNQPRGCR